MLRFFLRALGFLLLAAAAMFAVIDGTKSLAASHLVLTSFNTSWSGISPRSLNIVHAAVEHYASAFLWSPVFTTLLAIPTFIVLGALALLFLWLGKLRRRAYL